MIKSNGLKTSSQLLDESIDDYRKKIYSIIHVNQTVSSVYYKSFSGAPSVLVAGSNPYQSTERTLKNGHTFRWHLPIKTPAVEKVKKGGDFITTPKNLPKDSSRDMRTRYPQKTMNIPTPRGQSVTTQTGISPDKNPIARSDAPPLIRHCSIYMPDANGFLEESDDDGVYQEQHYELYPNQSFYEPEKPIETPQTTVRKLPAPTSLLSADFISRAMDSRADDISITLKAEVNDLRCQVADIIRFEFPLMSTSAVPIKARVQTKLLPPADLCSYNQEPFIVGVASRPIIVEPSLPEKESPLKSSREPIVSPKRLTQNRTLFRPLPSLPTVQVETPKKRVLFSESLEQIQLIPGRKGRKKQRRRSGKN